MESMRYISFLRFSMQLLICESVFLLGRSKKQHFAGRLPLALLGYLLTGSGWYGLLHLFPGSLPLVHISFYLGLVALTMAAMVFCYDLPLLELLFIATGGYAVEHISFGVSRIVRFFTGWTEEQLGGTLDFIVFRLLPYVLVAGLMYLLVIHPNRAKEEFRPGDRRPVLLAMVVMLAAIVLSVFYSSVSAGNSLLTDVICPLYSGLCCLLVLLVEYYVFRENRLERENKTMEQMLQIANAQQRSSKEAIDIINMKCHDLKHQIRALAAMSDAGKRSEYLEEVQKAVSIYDATYHTGCEALDYVLREKALLAEEHQVQLSCMADGDAIAHLHPADIYSLMGNALDNALESVLREPEEQRIISLNISRHGQMVMLHLENRCSRELEFQDGLPVTDKEDKNYHGFGVQSIRYIVRKYDGELLMRTQDGMFCLDILLPGLTADVS
ncbi:MAG: ATP-binding protein [Candidatus Onthomonas sp.]